MIQLTVGNSMSRITGLSAPQEKALKDILSYLPDAQSAYFAGGYNHKRYLIDKKGEFPTGLMYLVKKFIESNKLSNYVEVKDTRIMPGTTAQNLKGNWPVTPYPEQIQAAEACFDKHRGIVTAPTGVGKSFIVAGIIGKLRVRTLVVVPSLELQSQLTKTLSDIFGANNVGRFGSKCYIAVENVDALDTKEPAEGYDCVIIDEFHHSAAKTYRDLNKKAWNNVYYRFGLTATPFRSQDNERLLLESVLSEVIYRIEYPDAVQKGYIVPMEAYYIDLPARDVKGFTWQQVYKELIVNNESRNQQIRMLLEVLEGQGKSSLCLVKEIDHGRRLVAPEFFATGVNEDTKHLITLFNKGSLKTLVGTTGVIGEGVDTKPCEYVVIAGLGKSKTQFMQQCGRAFRVFPGKTSCKVIIFRDSSHKFTLTHFKAQCKHLRDEYGVIPVKLDLA